MSDPSPDGAPASRAPGEHPAHPGVVAAGCIAILVLLVGIVVATAKLADATYDDATTRSTVPAAPFYVPPTPLPAGPPGTIIASQPLASPPPGTAGW